VPKRNLAARAGHWSARHRRIAVLGWLAFVVIAFVLGGAIGTQSLKDEDSGNGESQVADRAIAHADFPKKADEQVLITARPRGRLTVTDPGFKAGVDDVVAHLKRAPHVTNVQDPFKNQGQLSQDKSAALVTFSIPGDDDITKDRVDATLKATAQAQAKHPELRIEQFGDASPTRR